MKRAGRLTALVLALLMLVNISASATTTGITLDELDMATYMSLVQSASETEESAGTTDVEDPWGLAGTCGEDNEYCVLVNELCALPTAQARYDFMMNLYSEDAHNATLETVMSHYYFHKTEHNAEGLICECNFPSFAPERKPGALNIHKADCPWTFANLSVAEQYSMLCTMSADDQAPYIATLSAEQKAAYDSYVNEQQDTTICDGSACDGKSGNIYSYNKLMEYNTDEDRRKYLNSLYDPTPVEDGGTTNLEDFLAHLDRYHKDILNDICICGIYPIPEIGTAAHDVAGCPWGTADAKQLLAELNAQYGEAAIKEWTSNYVVTTEMMQRALEASSLDSVVLENDVFIYVRTGYQIAYYKYYSELAYGEIIEPSCDLVVATVDANGVVTPVAEATAAN